MRIDLSETMFDRIIDSINYKIRFLDKKAYKNGFVGDDVKNNSKPFRDLKENLIRQREIYDNSNGAI